jgi:hypothetical protein
MERARLSLAAGLDLLPVLGSTATRSREFSHSYHHGPVKTLFRPAKHDRQSTPYLSQHLDSRTLRRSTAVMLDPVSRASCQAFSGRQAGTGIDYRREFSASRDAAMMTGRVFVKPQAKLLPALCVA